VIQAVMGLAKDTQASDSESLAESYGSWAGIRSNHVVTMHGAFSGSDGSSRSISTKEDRELLLALRSRADLIVVDAATARLEKYRAPRSGAVLAIFSSSGEYDQIPAVEESSAPVFLFTQTRSERWPSSSNLIHVQTGVRPFEGLLSWATNQKLSSLLLETGPTLTRAAFEAGIVSQSAITRTPLSPLETPETARHPFDKEAKLLSMAVSENAAFSLWSH
jgi:riboflavin biosynthesis pyrimidine reductase